MRKILWIVLLAVAPVMAAAQGYEWEWSPRAPRTMPTRFVGVELTGGYAFHQGTLPYVEDLVPCCTFETGTGLPFRLTVLMEQWIAPTTAFSYGGGVTFHTSDFTSLASPLPDSAGREIVTEYLFSANLVYLAAQAGIRQRLFDSFLSVGVDLRGMINVSSGYTLSERVVSPDDYLFTTNPPSREKELDQDVIAGTSVFVLEPAVTVQYDLALGTGMVLSPLIQVAMPLTSVAGEVSWRYFSVSAGVRLSRGL